MCNYIKMHELHIKYVDYIQMHKLHQKCINYLQNVYINIIAMVDGDCDQYFVRL